MENKIFKKIIGKTIERVKQERIADGVVFYLGFEDGTSVQLLAQIPQPKASVWSFDANGEVKDHEELS